MDSRRCQSHAIYVSVPQPNLPATGRQDNDTERQRFRLYFDIPVTSWIFRSTFHLSSSFHFSLLYRIEDLYWSSCIHESLTIEPCPCSTFLKCANGVVDRSIVSFSRYFWHWGLKQADRNLISILLHPASFGYTYSQCFRVPVVAHLSMI